MGMWEEHGVWHLLSDREEQIRPAAETLGVVVSGRLHIRDAQCEMKSPHSSPFKPARAAELMRQIRHYISALDCSLSQASNALRSMRLWRG